MVSIPNDVIQQFAFQGPVIDVHLCEIGHINHTLVVKTGQENGGTQRYILQRINQQVFRQPAALMENIIRVTRFLRRKIAEEGGDPDRETLTLIPTQNGELFFISPEGEYWRAYLFIEGARAYQQVESIEHLYQAARAFGRFMRRLHDFPVQELHITIPDFHTTPKRFEAFVQSVEADAYNRAASVRDLIEFALAREDKTWRIVQALDAGELPQRVTHNDTKFDNVLIDDRTGEGLCVLDLDTVMPGSALYDFGDFVRTGANTGAEDDPDLDRVSFSLPYFRAIARGFLEETQGMLTAKELQWLPLGAWMITFEQALRFLADYLNGDVYYRIHRPNQNLDRAKTQFKLVSGMEAKEEEMAHIVAQYAALQG